MEAASVFLQNPQALGLNFAGALLLICLVVGFSALLFFLNKKVNENKSSLEDQINTVKEESTSQINALGSDIKELKDDWKEDVKEIKKLIQGLSDKLFECVKDSNQRK